MSQYFPPGNFFSMVEGRYDAFRTEACQTGDKGLVTNIQKGAASIKTEFSRLEAIYKVPGERPEELDIPNEEKEKLFQLATDLAAMCWMLTERTVPGRTRQMRLSDLPQDGIILMRDGRPLILDKEKGAQVADIIEGALERLKVQKEAEELVSKMDGEIAKQKGGQHSIGEVIEGNKEAIEAALNKKLGGQGEVTINVNKAGKRQTKAGEKT